MFTGTTPRMKAPMHSQILLGVFQVIRQGMASAFGYANLSYPALASTLSPDPSVGGRKIAAVLE